MNQKHYEWILTQPSACVDRSMVEDDIAQCARELVEGYSHLQDELGLGEDATPKEVEAVMLPLMKDAVWAAIADHIHNLTTEDLTWKFERYLHGHDFVLLAMAARRAPQPVETAATGTPAGGEDFDSRR